MANRHYSPDSGPTSHLSVATIGKHGTIKDATWPGAAAHAGVVSIAPTISTDANSHN
jgi:hypothetical protein